jgi:prepilin-type N-terminal cleavage/methylation domain-containing protein
MNLLRMSGRKRRGFTLAELAIVVGVIGAIMSAIWWAASNAKEMQRDNDAVQELQSVTQGVLSLMQGRSFPATVACSGSNNITCAMITAQAIPSGFIDTANTAAANNPWSAANFVVWSNPNHTNNRIFRLSFYQVSQKGCLVLLLEGTNCQAGQAGCPQEVYTNGGTATCQPNQTGCAGAVPATGIGWQVMGSSAASAMCAANNYSGGSNSVEFDFSL